MLLNVLCVLEAHVAALVPVVDSSSIVIVLHGMNNKSGSCVMLFFACCWLISCVIMYLG